MPVRLAGDVESVSIPELSLIAICRREHNVQAQVARRRVRRVVEIAQAQHAKMLERLAAVSLGRLLRQRGEREDARRLVEGVYGWFTEGFESPDLIRARTLLAELA